MGHHDSSRFPQYDLSDKTYVMDPLYFKVPLNSNESVKIEEWELPHFYSPLHFHPEFQITYIKKSHGFLFVADQLYEFFPGNIFIIGPNIPHVFRNDDHYYQKREAHSVSAVSMFFTEKSFSQLFSMPEADEINKLLHKTVFGIKLVDNLEEKVAAKISDISKKKGFERILELLNILHLIANSHNFTMISLAQLPELKQKDETSKINTVYDYVLKNFSNAITLEQIAALVNMSSYSFCRFFKTRTNKTFIEFLNEIRIGMACKYLVDGKMNITEVAYATGYNSLSNFLLQFKKYTGVTPSSYQKKIEWED